MRVSALRIIKPQAPPPPPDLWEEFEDLRDVTLRHGRLWHDTADVMDAATRNRRYLFETYRAAPEDWLEQQREKNKAQALVEYEWHKPENVAARRIKAAAEREAQQAREAARANAIREQLVFSEAIRILREEEEEAEREIRYLASLAKAKAKRLAERQRLDAERQGAIAWWTQMNQSYAHEHYHPCKFDRDMWVGEVKLEANIGYWLPGTVRHLLFHQLGLV